MRSIKAHKGSDSFLLSQCIQRFSEISHECQGWCKGKDVVISLAQGKKRDKIGSGKDQDPLLSTAVSISSATHKAALQLAHLQCKDLTLLGLICTFLLCWFYVFICLFSSALTFTSGLSISDFITWHPTERPCSTTTTRKHLLSLPLHNSVLLVNHIDCGIIR